MSWVAIDDAFIRHPKIMALSDKELRVWIRLLCWCAQYRTKGLVPPNVSSEVAGATPAKLRKFLTIGLLDATIEGLAVHDWDEYNGNGRERHQARERKRLQRENEQGQSHGEERDNVTDENVTNDDECHGSTRAGRRAHDAGARQPQPQSTSSFSPSQSLEDPGLTEGRIYDLGTILKDVPGVTDYDWPSQRIRAIALFGGSTPGADLEADIVAVFSDHPQTVYQAIDRVAGKYAQGGVRSPWAVLRIDVQRAATPASHVRATDSTDRTKATANAEQWLRTAGLHFDRWDEVEDEFFGDRGKLRPWRTDQALLDRIRALWDEVRPSGIQVEADEVERGERWLKQQAELKARLKRAADETHVPT